MHEDIISFFSQQGFSYEIKHLHFHTFNKDIEGTKVLIIASKHRNNGIPSSFRIEANKRCYGLLAFDAIKTKLDMVISTIIHEKNNPRQPARDPQKPKNRIQRPGAYGKNI